uniref:Fatty-acid amide hydrolase 1 n=1 Tax=Latimeria chalumnae TaxID=7897 RepID=M3XK62_LATCH|nr:PREDICTED: vitamin D3 hydroxylase-associated protein-like isoform X2 [Latimeria chalumnae]|eukprot:XP_014342450.1 PREDICTED: vitamin D3 hydroxylase-associated protein-like isoform X2 [Latimeria chalumnae]
MALDCVSSYLHALKENWQPVLLLVPYSVGAAALAYVWQKRKEVRTWIKVAQENRERAFREMERAVEQFKKQNPGLTSESVLSLSFKDLHKNLQDGQLSPEHVLYTYIEKALEVTNQVNCVVDYLQECEQQLQEMKRNPRKGLLYGIPVSIKENIDYKGHYTSLGFARFLDKKASEDSVVVKVLKKQGAIPFVKTNLSQSMLSYDCSNPIYKQTKNPWNPKKTPGGSSGGEGALIGGEGSVLGFGTDLAGSIRMPSSFCGICGLKPTEHRISKHLVRTTTPGQKSLASMLGPMARDVDSLALCMKAVLCQDMFDLDPNVPPLPFNDEVYNSKKKLRIGYYDRDGFWLPHPSMRRAVMETKKLLEAAGHTLVQFPLPDVEDAIYSMIRKGVFADGCAVLREKFEWDVIDPNLTEMVALCRTPVLIRKVMAFFLKFWDKNTARSIVMSCGIRSVKDLWSLHVKIENFQKEFVNQMRKLEIDVILCPALGPALTIGYPQKASDAISYTVLYNHLNFPAGVVPVSKVTEEDEKQLSLQTPQTRLEKIFYEGVKGGVGLPIAVQCVALPWQEELCLRFMKEVETLTRK